MITPDTAWMRHPDLEGYAPTPFAPSQVPFMAAAGWIACEPPPPPVVPDDDESAEPDHTKKTTRRRKAPVTSEDH